MNPSEAGLNIPQFDGKPTNPMPIPASTEGEKFMAMLRQGIPENEKLAIEPRKSHED